MGPSLGGVCPEARIVNVQKSTQHRMPAFLLAPFHCIECTSDVGFRKRNLKLSDSVRPRDAAAIIAGQSGRILQKARRLSSGKWIKGFSWRRSNLNRGRFRRRWEATKDNRWLALEN